MAQRSSHGEVKPKNQGDKSEKASGAESSDMESEGDSVCPQSFKRVLFILRCRVLV